MKLLSAEIMQCTHCKENARIGNFTTTMLVLAMPSSMWLMRQASGSELRKERLGWIRLRPEYFKYLRPERFFRHGSINGHQIQIISQLLSSVKLKNSEFLLFEQAMTSPLF